MVRNGSNLTIRTVIEDDDFASPRKVLYKFFGIWIIFSLDFLVIEEISFVFSRDGIELETSRVEADGVFFATYVLHLHFLTLRREVPVAFTAGRVEIVFLNRADTVCGRNRVINDCCYKIGHDCYESSAYNGVWPQLYIGTNLGRSIATARLLPSRVSKMPSRLMKLCVIAEA